MVLQHPIEDCPVTAQALAETPVDSRISTTDVLINDACAIVASWLRHCQSVHITDVGFACNVRRPDDLRSALARTSEEATRRVHGILTGQRWWLNAK